MDTPSLVDRWLGKLKNNPLIAGLVILALVVVAFSQFIGGVKQIIDFSKTFIGGAKRADSPVPETPVRTAKAVDASVSGSVARGAKAADGSMTGIWDSLTFGVTQLEQESSRLRGTYDYSRQGVGMIYGALDGAIKGRRVDFTWCQDTRPEIPCGSRQWKGVGYFILSEDGAALQGQWRYHGGAEWLGEWTLKRR